MGTPVEQPSWLGECPLAGALGRHPSTSSRHRQLRWVLGELHRWLDEHPPTATPTATRTAAEADTGAGAGAGAGAGDRLPARSGGHHRCAVPTGEELAALLEAGATGQLRARRTRHTPQTSSQTGTSTGTSTGTGAGGLPPRRSTVASHRVRISCLAEVARWAGTPFAAGPGSSPDTDVAWPDETRKLLTHLAAVAATPLATRTWAVASLAAAGLRATEIASLSVDQSALPHDTWLHHVQRTPPGPSTSWYEDVPLPPSVVRALSAWLSIRDDLAASPRVRALVVSLHPTGDGTTLRPAGLPLTARSLHRAHAEAVHSYLETTAARRLEPLHPADLRLGRLTLHDPTP